MGIIWDLIRGAKTVANNVKWIFTQKPTTVTPQKTLEEEANAQAPIPQIGSFFSESNDEDDTSPTIDTQRWSNVWAWSNVDEDLGLKGEVLKASDRWDVFSSVPDFIWLGEQLIDKAVSAYTRYDAEQRAGYEAKANAKQFIVDANPTGDIITKVVPKDERGFLKQLELYSSELDAATTPEERQRAWQNFVKDVNTLWFEAVSAPNIRTMRDWWRRYSNDELASVMGKNVPLWNYEMTEEKLADYLNMLDENSDIASVAYDRYKPWMTVWLSEEDLEKQEKEAQVMNEKKQRFVDIATKDTLDLIRKNVASAKRWVANANVDEIVSDPIDRLLTSDMYLKELRDEAAETPELQRTEWQRNMIYNYDVVWQQLMDQYASNVNDYLMLQLTEWVDDKWEISDALWKFEDWSQLNDILRKNLGEIAGIDITWLAGETFWKVSALDIMRRFANETAYQYKQGKYAEEGGVIGTAQSAWNWFEHFKEPVWEVLAEESQTVWRLGTKVVNTPSYLRGGSGWNSPAAAWWDADFSVFKLIETDDSPDKRTIKKYGLQFGEYIPEWLWAVAPDIPLIFITGGWSAPLLLRNVGKISRFVKNFSKVKKYLNESSTLARTLNKYYKGLDRVRELWKEWGNIDSRKKRIWNIVDRSLSQFAIWQSMDANLSAFDTEPYSTTSFWLSMWGSLLWDILPEAKDIWWVMRTWAKGWKAWTKGTWVWDLVDFISQSDENAMLIAKQMWKKFPEFSEQDLKNYVKEYAYVTDTAKQVFENLTPEQKGAANQWTKELMYNYVKQAYYWDTRIWKAVRAMVENKATNPADIIKYIWWIPWTVSIGPYQSTIRLKQGTLAWVQAKKWWYDAALDSIDWWFGHKVSRGFTFKDIQDMSKIKWYEDVLKNREKYFRKVTEKINRGWKDATQTRWILSEDWLEKFWLEAKNLTLASLWIEISWAENVKEIFKEKMKELEGMNLTDETIDALAENWGYSEVVSKIENVLC